MDRRRFLLATGSAFAALAASGCSLRGSPIAGRRGPVAYGPLQPDPDGLLDLPEGFSYRLISKLDDPMDDGRRVPDKADGMGCFQLEDGRLVLVRNHELKPADGAGGILESGFGTRNGRVVPGGTTHITLDPDTLEVQEQFRSLAGTIRNCSGGITPWNSWLSCEEAPTGPGQRYGDGLARDHGWVFEVPANARGLVAPEPLTAMGRFNHEAACVDPDTGIVYLTEDRDDSVLYRFVPSVPGRLNAGGQLEAMQVIGVPDLRNWSGQRVPIASNFEVRWLALDNIEAPDDDLRHRAAAAGATIVARGEGLHMGQDEVYACSTNGGAAKLGQILRLLPGRSSAADRLEIFFESTSKAQFNYGDNLTVTPNGHLIVCEDQYTPIVDNYLRGITPNGDAYALGRLRIQTELAGACFSPSGDVLFVNAYSPTRTLAITGPWDRFSYKLG
jgi:secreted PhoX family phosphatase